jgi:hypothetical protein
MSLRSFFERQCRQAFFFLESKAPWLFQKAVRVSVLAPWWRDCAIINALDSILWLVNPIFDEIMTPAGKRRYFEWFDRNYSRPALEKKYPWLKHYRK